MNKINFNKLKKSNKSNKQKNKHIIIMIIIFIFTCFIGYMAINLDYYEYKKAKNEIAYYDEYKINNNMNFDDFKKYKYYSEIIENNDENKLLLKRNKNIKICILILTVALSFVLSFFIAFFMVTCAFHC